MGTLAGRTLRPNFDFKLVLAVGLIVAVAALSGCGGVSGNSVSGSGNWSVSLAATGTFSPGGTGQYTVTVTNGSSSSTSGTFTLTDTLPSVLTATTASGTGWVCTVGSTVSCTNATAIAAGGTATVIVTVHVSSSASGTVTNQVSVAGAGPGNGSGTIQTQIGSTNQGGIQHVVIIFQENRTPDNLFQGLCISPYGNPNNCGTGQNQYDIQSYGYNGTKQVPLVGVPLAINYDMNHGHDMFTDECDWNGTECLMDGEESVKCGPSQNCPSNPGFEYVEPSDVQPYLTMAQTYAFGDRMFQTNEGPSMPAHQYILSGTSAVCVPGVDCIDGTGSYYLAGNPTSDDRNDGTEGVGCLTPPGAQVNLIDTSQPFPNGNLISYTGGECMEHPTLTDLLDGAGLTWKYYTAEDGWIWTAPNAIGHMCLPTAGPADQLTCNNADWTGSDPKVVVEGTGAQVVTDIANCNLSSVTWVIPDGAASDHAYNNNGSGPSWVSSIVNQIGQNPTCSATGETYWNDTAIIVTWDDWGGWYDHVSPPIRNGNSYPNSYEYGFRVPILVISPYAKPGYVSHQMSDFGSILLFIEQTFGLGQINPSVGYADTYALGDLSDFFDFNQSPLPFKFIQSSYDKQYFVTRHEKTRPPDND